MALSFQIYVSFLLVGIAMLVAFFGRLSFSARGQHQKSADASSGPCASSEVDCHMRVDTSQDIATRSPGLSQADAPLITDGTLAQHYSSMAALAQPVLENTEVSAAGEVRPDKMQSMGAVDLKGPSHTKASSRMAVGIKQNGIQKENEILKKDIDQEDPEATYTSSFPIDQKVIPSTGISTAALIQESGQEFTTLSKVSTTPASSSGIFMQAQFHSGSFSEFDEDTNGFIDKDEAVELALTLTGGPGRDDPTKILQTSEAIGSMDVDSDQRISSKEFEAGLHTLNELARQ